MDLETFFSPDYVVARDRFRAAARASDAQISALELDARGSQGEDLSIDIAWLGALDARRLVLHTSGIHGVEAYAGAAVQLAALPTLRHPPADCAIALVHVLNPWGMSWLRRVNENNVDLNRNFLRPGAAVPGTSPLYAAIDPVLNPASPPGLDWFPASAAGLVMRNGFRVLRQAVTEGQYSYPRGLFYGGVELQPSARHYLHWLQRTCGQARYVFALDVHTGLGRWGKYMLIREPGVGVTPPLALARALGSGPVDPAQAEDTYVVRGSMGSRLPPALSHARVDFLAQEFGTYHGLRVLRALREENRWHHYGAATLDHPVKRSLLEALCPASHTWRARVVECGVNLLRAACDFTFDAVRTS